jgi:small-conductance mechanosensitive channel
VAGSTTAYARIHVLGTPAPSVFLTGFGASSLDFEIHAFVDSFEKRLPVQHELNLVVDGTLRDHGIAPALAAPPGPELHG